MKTIRCNLVMGICLGLTVPLNTMNLGTLQAADRVVALAPQPLAPAPIRDVAFTPQGLLTGQLLDAQGRPLAGSPVTIQFGGRVVAQAKTDPTGRFRVAGLRGGLHDISAAGRHTPCRLWTAPAAPPAAGNSLLLVAAPQEIARGQAAFELDPVIITLLGLGTGAVVMGAVNNNEIDHLEEKIDELLESQN